MPTLSGTHNCSLFLAVILKTHVRGTAPGWLLGFNAEFPPRGASYRSGNAALLKCSCALTQPPHDTANFTLKAKFHGAAEKI